MKILVVEDESTIATRIQRMIIEIMGDDLKSIHIANSFDKANQFLHEKKVDLLLLDLNLYGSDGLDLLKQAAAGSFHTIIISAYKEKAIEAFEYGVLDFIPKPFTKERLKKAIDRINLYAPRLQAVKYLAVKQQGNIILVLPEEIKYIKAVGDYCNLYMKNGSKLLHDKSLEKLEVLLYPVFRRIHKSYFARLDCIKKLHVSRGSKYEAELVSGEFLPIGRTKYRMLKEALFI